MMPRVGLMTSLEWEFVLMDVGCGCLMKQQKSCCSESKVSCCEEYFKSIELSGPQNPGKMRDDEEL